MWSRVLPKDTPIRVVQSIQTGTSTWTTTVTGVVESWTYEETGAWYAHGKLGKLWLPRIRIRKPDGELTVVMVDRFTEIAPLAPATWVYIPPSPVMTKPPTHRETLQGSAVIPRGELMPLPGSVPFARLGSPRIVVDKASSEEASVPAETGCFQLPPPRDGRPPPLKLTRAVAGLASAFR
jgi:hypothetical protein